MPIKIRVDRVKDIAEVVLGNKEKSVIIIAFDALLILLVANIIFVSWKSGLLDPGALGGLANFLILIIGYFLFVAIYSFCKYLCMGKLQEIFKKRKLSMTRFPSFLGLNLALLGPVGAIYSTILILTVSSIMSVEVSTDTSTLVIWLLVNLLVILVMLLVLLYVYTFINLTHFFFLKKKGIKRAVLHALSCSVKIRYYTQYKGIARITVGALATILGFYLFMKLFFLTSMQAYLTYGAVYNKGVWIIILVAAYSMILYNRFAFYLSTEVK